MAARPDIKQRAFEWFASAHPHEAAERDWPRFVAYVRQRKGQDWSEQQIRDLLAATADVDDEPQQQGG